MSTIIKVRKEKTAAENSPRRLKYSEKAHQWSDGFLEAGRDGSRRQGSESILGCCCLQKAEDRGVGGATSPEEHPDAGSQPTRG